MKDGPLFKGVRPCPNSRYASRIGGVNAGRSDGGVAAGLTAGVGGVCGEDFYAGEKLVDGIRIALSKAGRWHVDNV